MDNIDILLAVYNNENYLAEQLDSLFTQTYPHFRLIIRDDCSKDNSIAIIEKYIAKYPSQIVFIPGTTNLGAKGNFAELASYAEKNSTSDYFMFCDGDDVWLPTKIEDSIALMKKNEKKNGKETPLLIHSDLKVVNKTLEVLDCSFWKYSKLFPQNVGKLNRAIMQNAITGCTMLINRPLLKTSLPIPAEAIMHDWWIALVAAAFGRIDHLNKSTMHYRQHGLNDTGAKKYQFTKAAKKTLFSLLGKEDPQKVAFESIQKRQSKQALQFAIAYEQLLNEKTKKLLIDYSQLQQFSFLKQKYIILKNSLYRHGFFRNIKLLFFPL